MGEDTGLGTVDLSEARGVLAEVARTLPRARWGLSRMRLDVLDAEVRLRALTGHRPSTGPGIDGIARGEAVRGVVTSCQAAATAGARVDRRLRETVAGTGAAVVIVDGLAQVDTQDELDQIRVRRQMSTLQTDLEATQALLARTTRALGDVADQARQAGPPLASTGQDLPVRRVTGGVLAAQKQARYVDQELDRAQVLTDRIGTRVDTLPQAARDRMRAYRDHSPSASAPPPGVPR